MRGDWISVVAREKLRDAEWNRVACRGDCSLLLVVKSCKSCLDLSARKVKGKLRDASFWYANPRMAESSKVSMAVSETSDMSHDVVSLLLQGVPRCVCVPRGRCLKRARQ